MTSRWASFAAMLLAIFAPATAPLLASAEDVVIVASESDPQARLRSTGTIVDFTGRELVLELPSGARRKYPAAQVLGFETERSPELSAADKLFEQHDWALALEKYQQAAREEKRHWMGRQMLARMIDCAQELNRVASAGDWFLTLVHDDPTTSMGRMPLAWFPGEPKADVQRRAAEWLARPDPPAVLLGASWLLSGAERRQALERLDALAAAHDAPIAALAEAQTWRVRFAAADTAELAIWRDKVERFPDPLRAGPYLVLGRAWLFHRQTEPGVMALLRVPILFPDQRPLAAEALWLAAEALRADNQLPEAATLYHEMASEYPDARWAAEARARLTELTSPKARSPGTPPNP